MHSLERRAAGYRATVRCAAVRPGTVRRAGLVLALALVAACSRREPTAQDVVRDSSLRFLPAGTAGVAVVEVSRIEDRAALARWLAEASGGLAGQPGLAPLRAVLGGDLLEKVDRVALALIPEPSIPAAWAALIEGRFDRKTVQSFGKPGDIVTLVEVSGGPEVSLLVLPPDHLAVGPRAVLALIGATIERPAGGLEKGRLIEVLARVSPAGHAWGAIDYAPLARFAGGALGTTGVRLPAPGAAGALRGVGFEGRIAAEVTFDLVGLSEGEPGAKQLAETARGVVALARMGANQQRDRTWFDFLDAVRIGQTGPEVRVQGRLTKPMLEALAGLAARARSAGADGSGSVLAAPPPAAGPPAVAPPAGIPSSGGPPSGGAVPPR